ncbi:serine/threonine-protein phosphatase 7 [Tanacetum coccineum]|uniref:Serine/threonine-protein phosphatase 7 n=1 Tax=Tanacetum coccineum TaxID=301880 RepID=A0ABQ5G6G2_9ASTR
MQDVFALSGFPVNGEPLVCKDEVTKDLCDRYLGEHDENAKRSMRLKRRWLKENFEKVPSDVDEEKLAFYVRAYILHLIGTFILPDVNNRSHYPAYWLCFLEDLRPHALQRVAWGAAAYCKLTWELKNDATSFVGPWWLYETPRKDSTAKGHLKERLISIRDNMTSEDIILKPYEDYPSYRSQRIFFTRAVTFNFNNLVYHEPEKGHMQLLSQEPKEMGSLDYLETVSARGTKQRNLCERYEKYIKIWEARHEESWLMDTNDSSFTLPAIRNQIVLDQEEEPIADEMTDSEHDEEEPNQDDGGDDDEGGAHVNSEEDDGGDDDEGGAHVNSEEDDGRDDDEDGAYVNSEEDDVVPPKAKRRILTRNMGIRFTGGRLTEKSSTPYSPSGKRPRYKKRKNKRKPQNQKKRN